MFIVSALRRVFRPREQRYAGIVVERINDQEFAVGYPYNGKVYNIWDLRTEQEAHLVCDMLALKEAFDAQLNITSPRPPGAADAAPLVDACCAQQQALILQPQRSCFCWLTWKQLDPETVH
ncbi:hypothetical protein D9Q98_002696 [Chlorella vulgaris]|uniref:Uncharacterized protein n=1 Tax=Chlorella vulgaris TaxID=3077 RepID=A0A9D4TTQ6_CHLVU|nr:hypothetical protein D9Q98_002696 [Chlorella vulgaris]